MHPANIAFSALLLLTSAVTAQTAPLPANYQTVLDNPTVLVQRVHYGAKEFVPPHDHYPVVTVLVYLNDSGVVELAHDPKPGDTEPAVIKRPATHTGGWRIGPAAFERHSVRNLGNVPSDFFRVELKQVPHDWLKDQVRGPVPPSKPHPGAATEYTDARIEIQRIGCPALTPCRMPAVAAPSVLIRIPAGEDLSRERVLVHWLDASQPLSLTHSADAQYLRILLPQS